ncbi:MAG: hypothetical protein IKC32_02260 [Clostridia bacterium]|nr:hypothetical protein [Clostridia bacterium]
MAEERREEEYGSDISIKTPFLTKLENFWYHYKWHSIVAAFIIVAILVCTLQMCAKEPIDIHIMYAGNEEISRRSGDGDIPEYNRIVSALSDFADDYNGDGNTVLTLSTYFQLTEEEIAKIEADPALEVNYTLLEQDRGALEQRMAIGEYYLCLLSPFVYEQYKATGDGVSLFMPIAAYVKDGSSVEYYNDYAVKLSSTALYKSSPAVREIFGEDTDVIVALRINSEMSAAFGGAESRELYRRAEDMLRRILGE